MAPEDRDISSMTIGMDKNRIPELKEMINEFRNQIVRRFSTDAPPEGVVLLNMQLLPTTKVKKESRATV